MADGDTTYSCNNAGHPHPTYSAAMACDLEAHRAHVEALQQENQQAEQDKK